MLPMLLSSPLYSSDGSTCGSSHLCALFCVPRNRSNDGTANDTLYGCLRSSSEDGSFRMVMSMVVAVCGGRVWWPCVVVVAMMMMMMSVVSHK